MPCMGPNKPTEEAVEGLTNEIIQFIRKEYWMLATPDSALPAYMLEQRVDVFTQLREAIQAILELDARESF